MEHRFINKSFKCTNCYKKFRKLVHSEERRASCTNCGSDGDLLEDNEFHREEVDRTYRLRFDHSNETLERQYHPRTDVFDRNPSNIYGDPQRRARVTERQQRQREQSQKTNYDNQTRTTEPQRVTQTNRIIPNGPTHMTYLRILPTTFFIPYSISPFQGSVRRSFINFLPEIYSDFFQIPNNEFFMDNFASNFTSSFEDPLTRIIFLQSMQNQPSGSPPASKESLKRLKKFNMTEEYCKKSEKGELEFPSCSVCLTDIGKDQPTTLVPCGHMFHDECISKWLNMHNSCPVCRYELPTDDADYERQKSLRNGNNNQRNNNSSQSTQV
jgi:hypothetical protein